MAGETEVGYALSFRNLGMVFEGRSGSVVALEDFSFEVRGNEFITIVGPSGCGKSTLLQVASGLQAPTSGEASVGGQPIAGPSPDKAMVFQGFSLFPFYHAGSSLLIVLTGYRNFESPVMAAGMVSIAVVGLLMNFGFRWFEGRIAPWRESEER